MPDLPGTMARPPGADDEYQDLQKRFQILESDRKNLFEHTQLEVKKNKEALAKLKKENKELRSSLSSLMSVLRPRLRVHETLPGEHAIPPPAPPHRRTAAVGIADGAAASPSLPPCPVVLRCGFSCAQERPGAVNRKGLRNQQA